MLNRIFWQDDASVQFFTKNVAAFANCFPTYTQTDKFLLSVLVRFMMILYYLKKNCSKLKMLILSTEKGKIYLYNLVIFFIYLTIF